VSSDERSREEPTTSVARIPPGGFRELGPINWAISRLAARFIRRPEMHLFSVLGQRRTLFLTWLPFSGTLLARGKLPREDAELVILRVAHLRNCEYELQQHRRIARRFGLDSALQAKIFEGPQAHGLSGRQQVLLAATDEFINTRTLSDETWAALSRYLDRARLIEFCTLAGQYDALAATMNALQIPLDFPD
jgi:AhpD family alkylhydroperoxidase